MIDVAIIGGGVAALSAAIYLARAGKEVRVFDKGSFGGELNNIAEISNYPGFLGKGSELAETMRKQAKTAGAEVVYGECTWVEKIDAKKGGIEGFRLTIDDETQTAKKVLVATGAEPKTLDFEIQKPVSYCAVCDGALAKGKDVAVVGGGNSAVQESLYLAGLARKVTMIVRSEVKADRALRERLDSTDNITVREHMEPIAEVLEQFDHVFVFIGRKPATSFLEGIKEETLVEHAGLVNLEVTMERELLDADGYIVTGTKRKSDYHETEIQGLYAAGDVRSGTIKQAVVAAGDGVMAALEMVEALELTK